MLAMIAISFAATAQGDAWEIVKRMEANMTGYGNYRIDFTASAKGMPNVGGMYVVGGDSYYIRVQKQEQFSDGETRWEIDPSNKEVIIDYVDLDNRNILQNPTRAFLFAPDEFEAAYLGVETMDGTACHAIKLKPTGKLYGIGIVGLYVGIASELPVSVSYDFEGERLTVRIDKFTGMVTPDEAQFVFDPAKYRGYEIIDFRD